MTKFAEYILTIRKKDGAVLCHSSNYPFAELKETETTVDIMLTRDEFELLTVARTFANVLKMVDAIKWKIKYWGRVDV